MADKDNKETDLQADDQDSSKFDTEPGRQTAPLPTPVQPAARPTMEEPRKRRGGWFRRLLFVFLLLVVLVGLVVSAALLRLRLDSVLTKVDSLNGQLQDTQAELARTQADLDQARTDLENTQQALDALTTSSAKARADLAAQMEYNLLVVQAQEETSKAIVSIMQDDLGQARREITALQASLAAATALATDADSATLADLETRAGQAEADLDANSFASQQTLEVIWRDLNGLSATSLSEQ